MNQKNLKSKDKIKSINFLLKIKIQREMYLSFGFNGFN